MAIILLADNEKEQLRVWSEVLRRAGHDVLKAKTLAAARKYLMSGKPDLAVLDLHWGGKNEDLSGLELAKEFAESIPCILLTIEADVQTAIKAMRRHDNRAEAVDLVLKSEGAQALLEAVRHNLIPRVFVVHGHDGEAQISVVRFLEKGGARPFVIRDLPSEGRTIMEMIDKYSNVHYAIVLLTPDDVGGKKGSPPQLRPRARQNVILELGFFLGRLGRERVAALYKADGEPIEIPTDYQGVRYIAMDEAGGWQLLLSEEMKKAGIPVEI